MTPPVNISDVIKAFFDIINAGGNHASRKMTSKSEK